MTQTERIADKKAELDALRPVSGHSLAALNKWYDVELTYTSNALEGNTLTRSETAIVLEKGFTVSGKPLHDHMEAAGHLDALGYVRELATSGEPVRESDIRNIHRLVLQRADPEEAGRYPPVVIDPAQRNAYIESLEAIQLRNDSPSYHRFMNAGLETSLDHHLEILQRGQDLSRAPEVTPKP